MDGSPTFPDRRAFLGQVAAGACGLALCGATAGCATLNPGARLFEARAAGGRIGLGPLADLAIGGQIKLVSPDLPGPVLVARVTEDEVRAVSITCTHMGSELKLVADQRRFKCTNHGAEFAYDGTVLRGPASNPVAAYDVAHEEGEIYLIVPN
jgi:Rieske Fe-S protein